MADQADKSSKLPQAGSTPEAKPAASPPPDAGNWHEPPVQQDPARPAAAAGAWFAPGEAHAEGFRTPPNAPPVETLGNEPEPTPLDELPGPLPTQAGAWYMPPDAALEALLGSAVDTLIEQPPSPETDQVQAAQPSIEETQVQAAAETQAQPALLDEGWAIRAVDGVSFSELVATEPVPDGALADEAQPMQAVMPGDAAQVKPADLGGSAPTDEAVWFQPAREEAAAPAPDTPIMTDMTEPLAEAGSTPVDEAAWLQPAQKEEAVTPLPGAAEPAAETGSTPSPESTPPRPSSRLSPAEAAFLAEQRAAAAQAGASAESFAGTQAVPVAGLASHQPMTPATGQAAVPSGQVSQPTGVYPAQSSQPVQALPPRREPTPYDQVERKVDVLRRRFHAGEITRDELQNELRRLMILDDQGRWWMLGLESNTWYYYDGRSWIQAIPPGRDEPVLPVRGSPVPTETGVQQVAVEEAGGLDMGMGPAERPKIEIDEDGMPLPARVPQDDLGATMVSPSTPFMEPVRPSEAPTRSRMHEIETEIGQGGIISDPARAGSQLTQPSQAYTGGPGPTLRSETVRAGAEALSGIPVPARPAGQGQPGTGAAVEAPKPKPRLGEWPQPDYSAALGVAHNRNTYVKWGIRFGIVAIIGGMAITLILLLGMVAYYFSKVNQYSDVVDNLGQLASNFETTEIYNAQGDLLAKFDDPNLGAREAVTLDQISPWLIHATIATENETFYTDPGFSVVAILRAVVQNVQAGGTVSGASTITQQLARALVLDTEFASERTTERKIVEIIVASEIKRKYSKNQILEIYLNEIFYGNRAYGIQAAAQTYFNKPASELNPAEAAFLAGLPQSPATYDPVVNREAALARMHTVLRLMSEANGTGCIAIQHDDATRWGVANGGELCVSAQEQPDGSVLYFYKTPNMAAPEEMTLDIALVEIANFKPPQFEASHPHFVNYVWQQLEAEYGSQAIYSAGFRVYTTLDEDIQRSAEQAVASALGDLQARGIDATNASVVAVRPADGAVVAMVGSADYNNEQIDGQVNVAFTAQQPGSAIKPILYLAALEPDAQGRYWTPATVIWDVYSDFNGYVPVNYDRLYHGPKTMREALGNSLNVPAVKALNFVGLERFTEMAKRLGLRFPLGDPLERQAGLPTALGAVEVRLFDMVNAYAVLANNGRRVEPYSIVYIQDSKGNEIYRANTSPEGLQVVEPAYAYLVTNMLSDNEARAEEFGRGWPLELQGGRPAAVKTGTTNDSRDIWTIGYTPQLVLGVWVGNTDNRPMYNLSGYGGAAPIWNQVMEAAHAGQPIQQFSPPAGLIQVSVCPDSGAQPSPQCQPRAYPALFAASAPPPLAERDIYRTAEVDAFTGKLVNDSCRSDVEVRNFLLLDDPTAYNWINNTAEGNAWAQARGITVPVMPPPTEYCDPNEPRPYVVVSYPPDNGTVQDVIQLRGAITMPNFNRYEIRYGVSHAPEAFSQPLIVETVQRSEAESILGQLDTRQLANGPYTLRLVVIDNFGRSVKRDIRITINNPQPTPQPTALPTPTLAPTLPGAPVATPQPPGGVLPTPTLAPTLTPTWTLTPTPAQ